MNRNTLLIGFGVLCLIIALGILVPETFGVVGVLLAFAIALWALRKATPQTQSMDITQLSRKVKSGQSWWRRQASATRIAIVLAVFSVVTPPVTFLVLFGRATPCGVLSVSLHREVAQQLAEDGNPFAALGLPLAGAMIDRKVDSLSPLECLERSFDLWSGGLELQRAFARTARSPQETLEGTGPVLNEIEQEEAPAVPFELALRGSRPGFQGQGCIFNYEIIGILQNLYHVRAYAIGDGGLVLDSTTVFVHDLSVGAILEFDFSETDCDKIRTVQGQRH